MSGSDPFDGVRALADTVLFEGYMLYPYRADDPKNRIRWQFGVLAPPAFAQHDPSERDHLRSECLLDGADADLTVLVRFLHVQRRTVQRADGDGFVDAEGLETRTATYLPWDEAVVHEAAVRIRSGASTGTADITAPAAVDTELVHDGDAVVGRLVRERLPLSGRLSWAIDGLPGPYGTQQLRLRLANTSPWHAGDGAAPDRPDALRHALVAAHLLLHARGAGFISLIETPEWASSYAAGCQQVGSFPVLVGAPGDRSLVLAAPIILYDHPEIAPESAAQFCDATEMDEMLTLRTLTLTDEEKRLVRGSDARAAALVDQVDDLPPELMERLHGAIRSMSAVARPQRPEEIQPWLNAEVDASFDPETDVVMVRGVPISRGASVRLRPGGRRADAQDMFLDGRTATVEAVLSDLDGAQHLAVSLDDLVELADAGYNPHGRFLYFSPDEVEPIRVDA